MSMLKYRSLDCAALHQGYDLFTQRFPLNEELMELTGRKIDLIPEHELNPHLRIAVLKEAKNL
jgi:predicted nucleotidyltransferase